MLCNNMRPRCIIGAFQLVPIIMGGPLEQVDPAGRWWESRIEVEWNKGRQNGVVIDGR